MTAELKPRANRPCRRCDTTNPQHKLPGNAYCGLCERKVFRAMVGSRYPEPLPLEPGMEPGPGNSERRIEWHRLTKGFRKQGVSPGKEAGS
jgi:hypothetical protein